MRVPPEQTGSYSLYVVLVKISVSSANSAGCLITLITIYNVGFLNSHIELLTVPSGRQGGQPSKLGRAQVSEVGKRGWINGVPAKCP